MDKYFFHKHIKQKILLLKVISLKGRESRTQENKQELCLFLLLIWTHSHPNYSLTHASTQPLANSMADEWDIWILMFQKF